jgi:carbamoyltransferase
VHFLGLSFDFHDASATVLSDGRIVAAAHEERFTRVKHDDVFPRSAIQHCLSVARISARDLDGAVFYEDSLLKFDRIVWAAMREPGKGRIYLDRVARDWFKKRKFEACDRIAEHLGIAKNKVFQATHHDSHSDYPHVPRSGLVGW